MKKKILISILIIIIMICLVIFIKTNLKKQNQVSDNDEPVKTVQELKTEIGATASEEIYEVQKEYDGREVLVIKPDIQFKTVLTGILKNRKPLENEIENLDLSQFHKGIWISETSRNKFLQILKECKIENFEIDEKGYLYKNGDSNNKYSSKLEELINSDKLTIIDITGRCYIRDEMTGKVVEYPFKDMDLYQICEKYETEGSEIVIVTTNPVEPINILAEICN